MATIDELIAENPVEHARMLATSTLMLTVRTINQRAEFQCIIGQVLGTMAPEIIELNMSTVAPVTMLAWAVEHPNAAEKVLRELYPTVEQREAGALEWAQVWKISAETVDEGIAHVSAEMNTEREAKEYAGQL